MDPLGEIMRRRRKERGLSQADLAASAGVHLRQIRRYERGGQQPALAVGARIAAALGVSLDELAGAGGSVRLDGAWWMAWQTVSEGDVVIATRPVELAQRGAVVAFEAVARDGERPGQRLHGELHVWEGTALTGAYEEGGSRGTMCFALDPAGERAEGRWVGLTRRGTVTTGHAVLARAREVAQATVHGLIAPT
jgi:transcriptional regulator with XRE-family HTH domain